MTNNLIGIMRDTDIVKVSHPSIDEVTAFAEERGPGPQLNPMRLNFEGKIKDPWNADLAEQFHNHFMSTNAVDSQDEADIWDLFEQRFLNLKRRIRERKPKEDEDEIQTLQRVIKKKREILVHQRPHTRRGTVSRHLFLSYLAHFHSSSIKVGLLSRARID
jgi:hypothetical protein